MRRIYHLARKAQHVLLIHKIQEGVAPLQISGIIPTKGQYAGSQNNGNTLEKALKKRSPLTSIYTPITIHGSNAPTGPFVKNAPLSRSTVSNRCHLPRDTYQQWNKYTAITIRADNIMSTLHAILARCTSNAVSVIMPDRKASLPSTLFRNI